MSVTPLEHSCAQEVNKHLKHYHRRYNHSKLGKKVYVCILNGLIGAETLEEDTDYPV